MPHAPVTVTLVELVRSSSNRQGRPSGYHIDRCHFALVERQSYSKHSVTFDTVAGFHESATRVQVVTLAEHTVRTGRLRRAQEHWEPRAASSQHW